MPVPTKKRRCEPIVVNNVEMSSADIVGIEMDSSDQGGLEALPILLCAAVVSHFATYSITF